MLNLYPQKQTTLVIRRAGDGGFLASGPEHITLGYSIGPIVDSSTDGVWAQWKWSNNILTVTNDRFGFLPIYYSALEDGFVVSTSALDIIRAGADTTYDDAAIAVFLRLGYYVGNDTPFENIKTLPAGTRLTWDGGITADLVRTAPELPHSVSRLSREAAIREYGSRFQCVIEDMLPNQDLRMCCPLSAGRDSRHIFYALLRANRPPQELVTAKSLPPRNSTDAQTAAVIAELTGTTHTVVEQSTDRFADEMTKDLQACFCSDEHAQMVPISRWLSNQKYNVSWDGVAGDIFSCGVYDNPQMLTLFRTEKLAELASILLDDEGYLGPSLAPEFAERWHRSLAIKRLTAELEQYADLPNPVAPFFFYNRVRRELALCPFGMLNRNTHILAPYLRHEIFDLLINLPLEYFQGRQFHSEAIDAWYPELPQLPYVSLASGNVSERISHIWRFTRQLGQLATGIPEHEEIVQRHFLMPRLCKAMFSRKYGTRVPVLFSRLIVMLHLQHSLRGNLTTPSSIV